MNRSELQHLAEMRAADAAVLITAQRWAGAFYLLGYAIECGLKACAVRQFRHHEVPDRAVVNDFYTHRLDRLLAISGIKNELEHRAMTSSAFQVNWNTVRDWNESARYDNAISEQEALDMFNAVTDEQAGVLVWLRTQW